MTRPESVLAELVLDDANPLPEVVRQAAVRQLVDCVGVTLAASAHPAGRVIDQVLSTSAGNAQARLLGTGTSTSATEAAWGNGSLAHLLDFDDTGFSHPTACILPASLAVAEWVDASGADLVASLVLGYEVFERLAVAARPYEPVLRQRGIHPTSIWGAPAATAAAGRLLKLSQDQLEVAFGIAATASSGITQQFGWWAKGLNAGNAARTGVHAAVLAKAGYQGDPAGISGEYGLMSAIVGHGNYDLTNLTDELGKRWSIHDPGLSIKPYPACTSTLRAVDAMLRITADPAYSADQVQRIVIHVHPDLLHTLRFRAPTAGFSGKFSLDYTVASAALDGALTLASFDDESAQRPALRDLLAKVEFDEHPEWDISRRHENPVVVTLADGRTFEESVPAHRGSAGWPLTADEVASKYLACATTVLTGDQAATSLQAVLAIDSAPSVRRVVDQLVG